MDLSSKHEPEPPPATSRTQRLSALTARILSIAALILLFIAIFKFAGGVAWEGKTFFNAVRRATAAAHESPVALPSSSLTRLPLASCFTSAVASALYGHGHHFLPHEWRAVMERSAVVRQVSH